MMRLLIGMAAVSGMTLFSTSQGFGQTSRFYVTGALGPALTHDTDLKEFNGPIGPTTVKFDPGFHFRVAGGYQLTDWLATEVELGVSYNSIKSITGATEVDASL